jgi:hypothetical protein
MAIGDLNRGYLSLPTYPGLLPIPFLSSGKRIWKKDAGENGVGITKVIFVALGFELGAKPQVYL